MTVDFLPVLPHVVCVRIILVKRGGDNFGHSIFFLLVLVEIGLKTVSLVNLVNLMIPEMGGGVNLAITFLYCSS